MECPSRWSPPTLVSVQELLDHVLPELVRRGGRARLANILKRCRNREAKLRAGRWVLEIAFLRLARSLVLCWGAGRVIANDSKLSRETMFSKLFQATGQKQRQNKSRNKNAPAVVAAVRVEIVGRRGVGIL